MKNENDAKQDNKNDKKANSALTGTGKAANMMPAQRKMEEQSDADPAIKKDASSLLSKDKKGKKEDEGDNTEA